MSSGNRGGPRDLGRPRGAVLTAVATSALAAFSVLVLVGVLILAFGQDGESAKERRAQERAADPVLTANPAPPAPVPAQTETEPEVAGAEPTATAVPGETAAPGTGPGSIEVVVLNETKRVGLAGTFRDLLEAGGWTVKRTGDFVGNVPLTTVYYPPGFEASAQALEAQYPQVNRIRPAFSGIAKKRLTVILAKDYPKA